MQLNICLYLLNSDKSQHLSKKLTLNYSSMQIPQALRNPKMKTFRIKNGLVGILALLATELAREFYRPYIYSHHLSDFGIADTLGNSLGTVTTVFVILAIVGKNDPRDYRMILWLTIGLCAYELLQAPMGGSIDPLDILATVIAGVFCLILYRLMHRHPLFARHRTKSISTTDHQIDSD